MKARLTLALLAVSVLTACAGPSLRYRKDVNALMEKGLFENAQAKIEDAKDKYGDKDELLYLMDLSAVQSAAHKNKESNETLAAAQDKLYDLYARSISRSLGTVAINDYTQPYRPPVFEAALMHFYRGLDYLSMQDTPSAAVEARRAVFFLDKARESNRPYNDDPFVQYFASMVFEDMGYISDARIARANAVNAYEKYKGRSAAAPPDFPLPPDIGNKGEAVIFHFNGKAPYKISESLMFAWNDLWFTVQGNSDLDGVPQNTVNAVLAGAFGKSITVSFPSLQDAPYNISASSVEVAGREPVETQLVADLSAAARQTLEQEMAATRARTLTRAATKYILSVQARHAAKNISGDDTIGELVGMLFSVASNVTEKADTRSWFTLPAEIRMASLFLEPGVYDIKLTFYNNVKHAIDAHVFENVQINKGQRTYLYHRTAK